MVPERRTGSAPTGALRLLWRIVLRDRRLKALQNQRCGGFAAAWGGGVSQAPSAGLLAPIETARPRAPQPQPWTLGYQ
jgi:hypothetical protein